jgi:WD40 repeat protein
MRLFRLRSLALAFFTILILLPGLATARQGHAPIQVTPGATPVATSPSEWTVENIEVLDLDGSPVTMSPDGTMLAGIGAEQQLCIWDVASSESTCEEPSARSMNPDSIVWSPDGTAIAYTLDAFIRGEESDLFVFELDAGVSTNLTDDGLDDGLFNSDSDTPMMVDVMPLWSHDSQSLIFARSDFSLEEPGTHLMSISRAGGEPELVETVSDMAFAIFTRMYLLGDDSLLFTLGPGDLNDPDTGLWLLTPDGDLRQVLSTPNGSEFPLAILTDVHEANGTVLVAAYSGLWLSQFDRDIPVAFILDLGTGEIVPLESEDPARLIGPTVFSPDGATTFSVAPGGERDGIVAIHDGEHEVIELGAGDVAASAPVRLYGGIEWRGEGTIFLPNAMVRDPYLVTFAG